ncbi:MAG: OmpA family protein [Paludibacteraceae bacterium]|nr:OmpA family protein [Paludibacteraceae bacterium]
MIKRITIGLCLMLALVSCSINARISKADKKFALGEYYRAGEMYRSVYPSISASKNRKQKAEVAYKMGNSYRLIKSNKRAETALKNAIRYGYKDSIVYYHYAEVLRSNGKYDLALKNYDAYLKSYPHSEVALAGYVWCDSLLSTKQAASRYVVEQPKILNSKYAEFCPVFASNTHDLLYFNSTRGGKKVKTSQITGQRNNDIFFSRVNVKGEWQEPELLDDEGINTEFDEGACAISADGQTLYYTLSKQVKGETLGTAIYASVRSGGAWSEPKQVKLLKDSTISVAHPAPSPDGRYLYYVSDMPGGKGGKDIWRSEKVGEEWGEPENIGATINTEADEMFPSFREDGRLYFSSDGHGGFGGLDIYEAKLAPKANPNEADSWVVRIMPTPINSASDDFGITFAGAENRGFFSSNRKNKKFYDHLFSFYQPELVYLLSGQIIDDKGEGLGDARIKLVGNDGTIATISPKKDGTYSYPLKRNTKYVMMGACRGFLNKKETIEVPDIEESKTFSVPFTLTSISKPVKMENIFYKFGSAELTPESSKELDALVVLLNDNPNITIEIGAHTDYVGSDEANMQLSKERAQSVVNYLTAKGIEAERLTANGYGKTVPVVPDRALATKYRFLRYNVPLDQNFISKLNSEQQEIANQINRRTEFKVLKTTYNMF